MTGRIFPLKIRSLVPGNPQPPKTIEDDPGVLLGASLPVGVLDPQYVAAAGVAGI
jgi:hypothetical protein